MQDTPPPIRRKKRKRKNGLGYLFLFTLVFISALFLLSYVVKSYSPDVDVTIGNNEALTLSEQDMDVEVKTIDERLKWIQMEDDMPTVAVREPKKEKNDKIEKKDTNNKNIDEKSSNKKINKEKSKKEPLQTATEDYKKQSLDIKLSKAPIPPPKPLPKKITKVYVGKYSSIEDAMKVQHRISAEETDIVPFIKSINGSYVVQIGSFTEQERARGLAARMKTKGYAVRQVNEN